MAYAADPCLHVCFDAGDAIVLDLARNRYSAAPTLGEATDMEARLAAVLTSRFGAEPGSLRETSRAPPVAELFCARRPRPNLGLRDWTAFVRACAVAAFELRRGRLDRVLRRTSKAGEGEPQTVAPDLLRDQLERFVAMRPWWPRKRKCLFEVIALRCFLARSGIDVEIVFGVRARAFAAHCWIEREGCVVGDALERVLSYRAICWG